MLSSGFRKRPMILIQITSPPLISETERLMILFTGESKILIETDEMRIFTETLSM